MKVCTLASGSSGNAIYIGDGQTHLLLDAGIGVRTLEARLRDLGLSLREITALLVTHEHADHTKALPSVSARFSMPICGPRASLEFISDHLDLMPDRFLALKAGEGYRFGSLTVAPFRTPHDSHGSFGYLVQGSDGRRFALATDLGHMTDEVFAHLSGADFVLIESNHDVVMLEEGPYPLFLKRRILADTGHLCNEACADTVARLVDTGCRHFALGHLSKENNTPELALSATCSRLMQRGIRPGDVTVDVAPRLNAGPVWEF